MTGAEGGFFVPEHLSNEIWDVVANPPRGSKWRDAHPWRYRAWQLSFRLPWWLARYMVRWAVAYDSPAVSGHMRVRKG